MFQVFKSIYSMLEVDATPGGDSKSSVKSKVQAPDSAPSLAPFLVPATVLQAGAHAQQLFKLIDIDGDGTLTEQEFVRVSGL